MLNNNIKTRIKIIIMIILTIITIFSINNKVYADTTTVSTIFSGGRQFIKQGKSKANVDTTAIAKDIGGIGQVFLIIGIGTAVGVGMYLGFKYITSGADEKAKIKERLIFYVIAIVLLVAAVGVTKVIVSIGDSI
jgi:hypothetical protein